MNPSDPVADDEVILRHVPGGSLWQAPPDARITSPNFRLRPGETGVSVSRSGQTTPAQLIARLGDPAAGSRIATASVADIRAIGLEVVPAPLADDPGHAEIRSATSDLGDKATQRRLAQVFRYVTA